MTLENGNSAVDLDDVERLEELDSEDVLGAVERFSEQVERGWAIGGAAKGLPDADGVDSIALLGMGGSGVSGDVVQAVIEPRLPIPWRTIKSYGPLPEWVTRNTLVLAVSYSGSTEETLAAMVEAQERGARAIALSSGGPLKDFATEHGIAHIEIPSGLQPRASLGYLTLPLLAALAEIGLVPDMQDDVDETVEVLRTLEERCHRSRSRSENPAKDLAARISGRVPVVYGGHGVGAVAAYRFKCDLNEYGKTPAFWHEFPELNHNEIVGWNQLSDLTQKSFMAILLRSTEEHPRIQLRFEITRSLIEDSFSEIVEVPGEGQSPLAQLLSLILITQLAAIYLGLSYGVDPGPVEVIQNLKKQLAER
ncbi:MAG: bifunctional phosphoglucose/phosphomannose isomerase [Actinomycetota bacterium]|nr:bifunctional phosphoglucose/phosphomannose isomerase [Actinomycetota bacterium]